MNGSACIGAAGVLALAAGAASGQVVAEVTFENPSASAGDPITNAVGDVGPEWSPVAQGDPQAWPQYSAETPTSRFPEYVSQFSGDFSTGTVVVEQNELDLPESWTIEAFVRFENVDGHQTFIGREGTVDGAVYGELYFQKVPASYVGEGESPLFKVEFLHDPETSSTTSLHSATPVEPQTWYHLAAVYDADAQRLSLYVDGQLDGVRRASFPMLTSDNYWTIGRGWYANNPGDWFNGQIDGVRFSSGALSPSEFQINVPGTGEPGCAADEDGDGDSDVQDLLAYLRAFRAGCD